VHEQAPFLTWSNAWDPIGSARKLPTRPLPLFRF
jgi:hypothetical protein